MTPQSCLIGLCLLVSAAPSADPFPKYAVAPDTVIERVYLSSTKLASEPMTTTVEGQVVDPEGGEVRLQLDDSRRMAVTDTIGKVTDGRPVQFTRKYGECTNSATETLQVKPPTGKEDVRATTRERTTALTDKTVRFAWNGDAEEYEPVGDVKGLDKETLAGLAADSEWLALLDGGPREKGAEFSIDPQLFVGVGNPLGELRWQVGADAPDAAGLSISSQLSENLDGKAKATWQGSREVDGRTLSVFALEAELKSHAAADMDDQGGKREVELGLEYEGEVLFDIAAGRLSGYSFEADAHMVYASSRAQETPQGKVHVRQSFDLAGKAKHVLSVTSG